MTEIDFFEERHRHSLRTTFRAWLQITVCEDRSFDSFRAKVQEVYALAVAAPGSIRFGQSGGVVVLVESDDSQPSHHTARILVTTHTDYLST